MEREGDTSKPDTPAEAMESSESEFEETVKEESDMRPTGSGGRTPASPPNS
jgi:hypothetical protein